MLTKYFFFLKRTKQELSIDIYVKVFTIICYGANIVQSTKISVSAQRSFVGCVDVLISSTFSFYHKKLDYVSFSRELHELSNGIFKIILKHILRFLMNFLRICFFSGVSDEAKNMRWHFGRFVHAQELFFSFMNHCFECSQQNSQASKWNFCDPCEFRILMNL